MVMKASLVQTHLPVALQSMAVARPLGAARLLALMLSSARQPAQAEQLEPLLLQAGQPPLAARRRLQVLVQPLSARALFPLHRRAVPLPLGYPPG